MQAGENGPLDDNAASPSSRSEETLLDGVTPSQWVLESADQKSPDEEHAVCRERAPRQRGTYSSDGAWLPPPSPRQRRTSVSGDGRGVERGRAAQQGDSSSTIGAKLPHPARQRRASMNSSASRQEARHHAANQDGSISRSRSPEPRAPLHFDRELSDPPPVDTFKSRRASLTPSSPEGGSPAQQKSAGGVLACSPSGRRKSLVW